MSAAQTDEAAPDALGSLDLSPPEIPTRGDSEPWPTRLASVTPLHEGETVLDEQPAAAPAVPAASSRTPDPEPEPESGPGPESEVAPTPERFPLDALYPAIYWSSIILGLVSQVIGFSHLLGGGFQAWLAAVLIGGFSEATMVTTCDKALNWLAAGWSLLAVTPFMVISVVAAHFAVAMVYVHWIPILPSVAPYFAFVAALGYLGHLLDGGIKAIRSRRVMQAWQRRQAEQRQARADEQRRQQRTPSRSRRSEASSSSPASPASASSPKSAKPTKPARSAASGQVTAEAVRQVHRETNKGARAILTHFKNQGYSPRVLPSVSTVDRWIKSAS